MKVKRILITGDDGYNSIGIRLLVHYLKKDFDLEIAATKTQMSGVGGHLSLRDGGFWNKDHVDGVNVFWVDGYPCDAMECAVGLYKKPFDLVISGMNMGMNVGQFVISSGTYTAGLRALALGLAPRVLVASWMSPPEMWQPDHSGNEILDEYVEYPGNALNKVVRLAINNKFWGANFLNINLPTEKSDKIRFTRGLPSPKQFFNYPMIMDTMKQTFKYPEGPFSNETKGKLHLDTGALLSGYITISPQKIDNTEYEIYEKMKGKTYKL